MSRNPILSYQDLLVQADTEAREDYEFDPRVQFYSTELRGPEEPGYEQSNSHTTAADATASYDLDKGEDDEHEARNTSKAVQKAPKTIETKMIVVMDTAQRDWVQQPNAYSLTFKFGSPALCNANTTQRVPIYSNSRYIPLTADQNSNQLFLQPNIYGFTLCGISFPPYNPLAPAGPIEAYDVFSNTSNIVSSVGSGFFTNKVLSNVQSLKIARVSLPYRRFTRLRPSILPGPGNFGGTTSPSQATLNQVTSFASEPYILMYLNNYQGQYTGGNDPINRAFSVLAQDRRITLLPTSPIGTQFHDYYPWSDESYKFVTPEAYIKEFNLSLTRNNGLLYEQQDDIEIESLFAITGSETVYPNPAETISYTPLSGVNLQNVPGGNYTGTDLWPTVIFRCRTRRRNANAKNTSGDNSAFFNANDIRLGDRIQFYLPALSNLLTDPSLNASPYADNYKTLFKWMSSNDAFILSEAQIGSNGNPVVQVSNVGPDFYNCFDIAYDATTTYGTVSTGGLLNISGFLPLNLVTQTARGTTIPILNTNVQATFTFEVTTLTPDTKSLSIEIVK